jgi:hypothetical protein
MQVTHACIEQTAFQRSRSARAIFRLFSGVAANGFDKDV